MVKNLKGLLLWNQTTDDLDDDPGLTLTYFTARSNLVPYAFVLEKGKLMDFSEIILISKLVDSVN